MMTPHRTVSDVTFAFVLALLGVALLAARQPGTAGSVLAWWAAVFAMFGALGSWWRAALLGFARDARRCPCSSCRHFRPSTRLLTPDRPHRSGVSTSHRRSVR